MILGEPGVHMVGHLQVHAVTQLAGYGLVQVLLPSSHGFHTGRGHADLASGGPAGAAITHPRACQPSAPQCPAALWAAAEPPDAIARNVSAETRSALAVGRTSQIRPSVARCVR